MAILQRAKAYSEENDDGGYKKQWDPEFLPIAIIRECHRQQGVFLQKLGDLMRDIPECEKPTVEVEAILTEFPNNGLFDDEIQTILENTSKNERVGTLIPSLNDFMEDIKLAGLQIRKKKTEEEEAKRAEEKAEEERKAEEKKKEEAAFTEVITGILTQLVEDIIKAEGEAAGSIGGSASGGEAAASGDGGEAAGSIGGSASGGEAAASGDGGEAAGSGIGGSASGGEAVASGDGGPASGGEVGGDAAPGGEGSAGEGEAGGDAVGDDGCSAAGGEAVENVVNGGPVAEGEAGGKATGGDTAVSSASTAPPGKGAGVGAPRASSRVKTLQLSAIMSPPRRNQVRKAKSASVPVISPTRDVAKKRKRKRKKRETKPAKGIIV